MICSNVITEINFIYLCLNVITNTFNDYSRREFITQVNIREPESMIFPAITICEWSLNNESPNIRNSVIKYSYLDKQLNLTELDYFKYISGDCLRFNGYINDSAVFNHYEFQLNDSIRKGFKIVFKASDKTLYNLYISDNYLTSLKKLTPIRIENQKESLLYISKTVHKKLEEPYNDCRDLSDKTYRHDNCFYKCIEEKVFNKYNCSMGDYFRLTETLCKDLWLQSKKEAEFKEICKQECPNECETTTFDYQSSQRSSKKRTCHVRFSEHTYQELVEIPKMNIYSLISSIGGTLGLFFGMRFLSFIEFLEFIFEILYIFLIRFN